MLECVLAVQRIGEGFGETGAGRGRDLPGEEEREGGMEAGVVDCGPVAAEHGDGVRGRAAAGPFEACHLVLRLSFGGRGRDLGWAVADGRGEA